MPQDRPFPSITRWLPWVLTLVFALVIAWQSQRTLALRAAADLHEQERHLAELELRGARQRAEAERLLAARQLEDATREAAGLANRLVQANAQISDLTRQVGDARRQLAARQADLAEVHAELVRTTAQLDALREQLRAAGVPTQQP